MTFRTLCLAVGILAAIAGCSSSTSDDDGGPTGSAPNSSNGPSKPTKTVVGSDACALLSKAEAEEIVGKSGLNRQVAPYDIETAVKNLDRVNGTHRANGYRGQGRTCGYTDNPDKQDPDFTGVAVTLITDSGSVSSYDALGYGQGAGPSYDSRLGVPSEMNPNNKYVAARIDARHTVIVYSKKGAGTASPALSVRAIEKILSHLR